MNTEIGLREAVQLSATDSIFYSRYFFPRVCRQPSPDFHGDIWKLFDSAARYKSVQIFRDGAKTSLARLFISKRIAYALSHTVLFVGKSLPHAARSVAWIARNVEFNTPWAQAFQLTKGSVWNTEEIRIHHGLEDIDISVLPFGITGSIRGTNIDSYRPDAIIVDDVCDEENTGTKEQRQAMENLIFGALKDSLAPISESPLAMLGMLGTPLDPDDVMAITQRDSEWAAKSYGIFDDSGFSRWAARWPTDLLLAEKEAAIKRNQLDIWMREKECQFISRATADFLAEWLQYYEFIPEHFDGIVIAIDPVPPASDRQIAKDLRDKDFEVLSVVGLYKGRYYLLEYCANRGHTPEWTVVKFFELLDRWHPNLLVVESVAYQRTLAWLLQRAMREARRYVQVKTVDDRRSKRDRINDALNGVASNKLLFVSKNHTDFIEQFTRYPKVSHDDILDSVAVAVGELQSPAFQSRALDLQESAGRLQGNWRHAP